MRRGKAAALEVRWAIPHLLVSALAAPPDAAGLLTGVQRLCSGTAAAGIAAGAPLSLAQLPAMLASCTAEVRDAGKEWSTDAAANVTQLLLAGVLAAAAAAAPALAALASGNADCIEPLPLLSELSAAVSGLLQSLSGLLSSCIRDVAKDAARVRVLPGWVLNHASVLLQETCMLLSSVLQVRGLAGRERDGWGREDAVCYACTM